jgi:hypothetical protein
LETEAAEEEKKINVLRKKVKAVGRVTRIHSI